jgi:outer membrane protein assembly factor BamB
VVDPETGRVLSTLAGIPADEVADVSAETPGLLRIAGKSFDPSSGKLTDEPRPVVEWRGQLERREASGKVRWSKAMTGVDSVRPPYLAIAAGRAVLARERALVAFDVETGKQVWKQPGPSDRLLAWGALVVGVDCTSKQGAEARWLVARQAADGVEAFRTALPTDADPDELLPFGDRLFVPDHSRDFSWLLDRTGAVLAKLEYTGTLRALPDGWLSVSAKRLARLSRDGKVLWQRPVEKQHFRDGGAFVPLPGGDVVALSYSPISDSGVELLRLDPATGVERWHASAEPLRVSHSKYFHLAYAVVRGARLVVVSQGSFGTFVEVRALSDGALEHRTELGE